MKGPSTEGVFRKAANEKARKELKEDLNKGGNVDLKSKSVHLLAVVLKVSSSDLQWWEDTANLHRPTSVPRADLGGTTS